MLRRRLAGGIPAANHKGGRGHSSKGSEGHLSLREVVENTAGPERSVVVVGVAGNYMEMLLNWANSVEKLGYGSRMVFIAEDAAAYAPLRERWPLQVVRIEEVQGALAVQQKDAKDVGFGSMFFDTICNYKPKYILALLNLNVSVLYNDVDMVWLQDPYKHFIGDLDVWLQEDSVAFRRMEEGLKDGLAQPRIGDWKYQICACFIMLRPTEAAKRLIVRWGAKVEEAARNRGGNDQQMLNAVIENRTGLDVKWAVLPVTSFPSGCLYFGDKRRCQGPHKDYLQAVEKSNASAVVVHNNWIKWRNRKKDRFKEYDLWSVPDEWNSSAALSVTQVVARAAGEARTVVAVQVTEDTVDFLPNWVASVTQHGYKDRILIIASDEAAYNDAVGRWPHHTVKGPDLAGIFVFGARHREDRVGSHDKLAYQVVSYLLALTMLKVTTFSNSVTHVWLGDPYPFLEGEFDLLVHENSPLSKGELRRIKDDGPGELIAVDAEHQLCTCLMHVRPTAGTTRLLEAWFKLLHAWGTSGRNPGVAQELFNQVLAEYSKYDVTVKVLSPLHFPSGCALFGGHPSAAYSQKYCRKGHKAYLLALKKGRAKTILANNNWIVGHDNIMQRFKEKGLWLLEGSGGNRSHKSRGARPRTPRLPRATSRSRRARRKSEITENV